MAPPVRFVGRRGELRLLAETLEAAKSGNGSVVLLVGPLGAGKTRLAQEFATRARRDGVLVGAGRWYESREMPTYVGFSECLLDLACEPGVRDRIDPSSPYVREVVRLGPEFNAALGLEALPASPVSDDQYRLWRGVASVVHAASTDAPTLIVLDDLQWADPGSLALLSYLGETLGGLRVLILGLCREEDAPPSHPLHRTAADLARAQVLTRIKIGGLSKRGVAMIAESVSGYPVAAGLLDVLYTQTQGNPLFVSELVRHLGSKRALRMQGGKLAVASGELDVPDELRDIMSRRLARLSEGCRALLGQASALARDFDLALIEQMSDGSRVELLASLDEAVRSVMLQATSGGTYAFAHPLLRSVVYESLPPSVHSMAHLRAAEALVAQFGSNASFHAREIAAHLLATGGLASPEQTTRFCLQGARQARQLFAFEEVRTLLLGGLAASQRMPGDTAALRGAFLKELGYAETALGSPDEGIRCYKEALGVFRDTDERGEELDTYRWLAAAYARYGRWPEALSVSREGLEGAEEEQAEAYVGLVGSHAMALMVTGSFSEAERWVKKLLELSFDDATRAVANHSAACWHTWAGGEDQAGSGTLFRTACDLFRKHGLDGTAAQVAFDLAVTSYVLGQPGASAEAEHEAEHLAAATGRVSVSADLHAFRSLKEAHRGNWADARRERERWEARERELGGSTVYGQLAERSQTIELYLRDGPAQARALVQQSEPLISQGLIGLLCAEAGEVDEARALVEPLAARAPADGRGFFWLALAAPLAQAMCLLKTEGVQHWYGSLLPYRGCVFDWLALDTALGRIADGLGLDDAADEHFEDAIALSQRRGLWALLADAQYRYAVVLRQRRRPADRQRAQTCLRQASELCRDLQLGHLGSQVGGVLTEPRRGRPHGAGPQSLTDRERTVLRLLAAGHSNRRIAEELVLSERTVAHHLTSIYAKLGVRSRGAAIAWASQHS